MRRLVVDGLDLEFDDQTAIGIDIQCLDIKEPGVRKLKTSNSFTVPATMVNKNILGIVGGVQSEMTRIYQPYSFTYYQGNERLINGAKLKIDTIDERIGMTITEAKDFFDTIKELKGKLLFQSIDTWLYQNYLEYNYYNTDVRSGSNLKAVLEYFASTTKGVHFPFVYGPLYEQEFESVPNSIIDAGIRDTYIETEYNGLFLSYSRFKKNEAGDNVINTSIPPSAGCHFYLYAHTFVKFLQEKYGISLGSGLDFDANAWNDVNFQKIIIPIPAINLTQEGTPTDKFYYFKVIPANNDGSYSYFDPLANVKMEYSAYDILMSLVKIMSATIDNVDGSFLFRRLDELETKGAILNWTGKIDAKAKRPMKPMIPNYFRNTYIKYEKVEAGVSEFTGSKTVVCSNQNLPEEGDLFKVKGYLPMFGLFNGEVVPLMTKANSLTNPVFLSVSDQLATQTLVRIHTHGQFTRSVFSATLTLRKAAVYSLSGEYNFLDKINTSPKFYTVDLWLTNNDIRDLDNFTMVYLQELNGMFYVNKISGWNPDKSKSAVSVELIRISDRTPVPPADNPYFFDGQGNVFTDGQGNYFY